RVRTHRRDFVKGGYGVSRADVARVHFVVVEVGAIEYPRLVSDQAVFGDTRGIELDLQFHIFCDGEERRPKLVNEDFARLVQGVDVSGNTVSGLSQLLHGQIVVIARAKTKHREKHATSAFAD